MKAAALVDLVPAQPATESGQTSRLERAELRHWGLLAVSSLAIAGAIALLLAFSRLPGIERVFPWPLNFFGKGLVIHVVFSLIVWFLTCLAFLMTLAMKDRAPRHVALASLGSTGAHLVSLAFPFLLLPAFLDESTATLNNYVPVLVHRSYYFGLMLLALGIAMPAVRLLANADWPLKRHSDLRLAATGCAVIYLVALACIAVSVARLWGEEPTRTFHEQLFWGGGHVFQFLNATVLITGWVLLLRKAISDAVIDPDVFRVAVLLIPLFSFAALAITLVMPAFSPLQTEAFRRLQFVLAFPTLLVAVGGLNGLLTARRARTLPWDDPAFVALILSPIVFAVGGVMGLLITTSDTRTPAHYHGVITGVNLALIGLFLKVFLPALGREIRATSALRIQIVMFGVGQLIACIGLFLAGGYGAPRKAAAGTVTLVDGAVAGMYLHGIGALLAIIGGTCVIAKIFRALLRSDQRALAISRR